MTTYNTGSDSANTSVRAFLTKVGEFYLGRSFNTRSGKGQQDWQRIQTDTFNSRCAYCDRESERITIEHLVMFNKSECGLHHPGNVVPCCVPCNSRQKDDDGNYHNWEDHLLDKCGDDLYSFKERRQRIIEHIAHEGYPKLTEDEMNALKAITAHLYTSTKSELDKSLALYQAIDETLVSKRSG